MYDTVNFWMDWVMADVDHFAIAQYLSNQSEHRGIRGYSVSGYAGDYFIKLYESGISLKGSLPKLLLPDNIHTLSRAGARDAIEKLSDIIHLPVKSAKVTRVDVSTVLPMNREPNEYFQYMGNKPHYNRLQATNNTLYYITNKRQLVFYDKRTQSKAKGISIPIGFEGANLLRIEARYLNRLPIQFKLAEITGATLSEEKFYTSMVKNWGNEYFSINKIKSQTLMDTTNIKTPKDGVNAMLSILLQEKGQEYINNFIIDLRAKNTFSDPKYYSRLKDEFNKLIVASKSTDQNELIRELDKAVREVILNCR